VPNNNPSGVNPVRQGTPRQLEPSEIQAFLLCVAEITQARCRKDTILPADSLQGAPRATQRPVQGNISHGLNACILILAAADSAVSQNVVSGAVANLSETARI
jgi:hypothetical protein